VSLAKKVVRRTIPLCGIVLILGTLGCGRVSFYSYTTNPVVHAQNDRSRDELVSLIEEFLKNVPNNERATFDAFFADDVLYTRGTGVVITKKDILADTGKTTVPRANATFSGEEFTVHRYGDTAVVNFRLVMHATENDKPVTRTFRNTGTFMRRNGRWQAVAWQATPIAEKQ
jgi:ketosteroid isomerase-like protein